MKRLGEALLPGLINLFSQLIRYNQFQMRIIIRELNIDSGAVVFGTSLKHN